MQKNQPEIPQSQHLPSGRFAIDNFPLGLAKDSVKVFPDGTKGRKHAIITLLALLIDPELPEEVKRFLTQWGYDAENYPTEIDPRGLYRKFMEVMEEEKQS